MAAKQKKNRNELRVAQTNAQSSQDQNYTNFSDRQKEQAQAAYNLGGSRSGDLWNSYRSLATKGVNGADNSNLGSGTVSSASAPASAPVGPGSGRDYFSEAEDYSRKLAGPYGGLNEDFYKKMMNNGGLDEKAINNFRGNGVFEEFQKTGGWNDADKANFRSRAGAVLPAMYQGIADDMARRRNVQGGYAPGFGASTRAMARQQGQAMSDANINSELGLADQIRSGRQWGATGGSAAENALQSLISGNMLQTEGMANTGRIAGAGNLTQIGGGRTQRDSSAAATAASRAATAAADARAQAALEWDREKFGLSGAQDLYQFDRGMESGYDDRTLAGMSQQDRMNLGYFGGRQSGIDSTPGWQDTVAPIIGAGAGIAGAFMGGGGSPSGASRALRSSVVSQNNPWSNIQF